ncbi:hypothetical protein CHLRE_17g712900v5 [Chlamydomonas reinhardtii]|uniref:Uncharacterized protein n=1 Tax=Chlamydomonas reinhardtii TaxID=3055 RepID=A8JDF0_CHLRE|nr:uncharacterized protein CHLRE_17g712900v5 [Chlamydomonas reinhardtii]PNW70270.1 hypothetical protein CHLRE_17g712900v5 [Chlamydomonas reinhardtii]|eukprot:XP_001700464.1 predicted protein [Chlamydomonas reinhardtii]
MRMRAHYPALLVAMLLTPEVVLCAIGKASSSAGGGSRSSTTTTTTTTAGRTTTATTFPSTSYGFSSPARITAVGAGVFVLYGGHSYPSTRIIYDQSNTDDCALRNVTAAQLGGNDFDINPTAVNRTLPLILSNTTGRSILEFNNTLYNQTGLIVDPDYCNYTRYGSAGGGSASAARVPVLLALVLGAVTAMWAAVDSYSAP